jgi:hypothetical protein
LKTRDLDIWLLLRINIVCSFLVWLISRFNLYMINKKFNGLIYLIPNAIVYTLIILILAYTLRNNKKLNTLVFAIIVTIYTINFGLFSNLILPLCNGNLDLSTRYTLLFLMIIILTSFLAIKLNYSLKKDYKWLILFLVFGLFHFIIISTTYFLNYIIFYEYIFKMIVS